MDLHVFLHGDGNKIDEILRLVRLLRTEQGALMATVADIQAAVASEHDAVVAVTTLLDQLFALVQANVNDPAALQQILDDVNADKQAIVEATLRDTPASPDEPTP